MGLEVTRGPEHVFLSGFLRLFGRNFEENFEESSAFSFLASQELPGILFAHCGEELVCFHVNQVGSELSTSVGAVPMDSEVTA